MAKFEMRKANTPEKRAVVRAKEMQSKDKAAIKLDKQRQKNKTDAAKKKEITKAEKRAKEAEKELRKSDAMVAALQPPKRRGRPPKNLAAAMAAADSAAAAVAKQVISDLSQYPSCHSIRSVTVQRCVVTVTVIAVTIAYCDTFESTRGCHCNC